MKTVPFLTIVAASVALIVAVLATSGEQLPKHQAVIVAAEAPMIIPACVITWEQFNQIRLGIPYAAVRGAIGCDGDVMSETDITGLPQFRTVMYTWKGTRLGSNAVLMFQGDRLISKSQMLLNQ